ncbi:MAG: cytochrome c [Chloroflexi bacterium]|nr:cytochrome c [Chloroflexota bacterium]
MKRYDLIAVPLALIALLAACTSSTPTPTPTLTNTAVPTRTPVTVSPELGAQLARQIGCAACHRPDGNSSVGPTWKGLFGSEQPLTDGSAVLADEAYLRESILNPNAKVVEGFGAGIMPQNFRDRLSDAEIQSIVEYIKTLR